MRQLILPALAVILIGGAMAADSSTRVITVKAAKMTGNPRTGPFEFTGNVTGKVKDLSITAASATLSAPNGVNITEAEGKRTAEFSNDVTVMRGRLTATGPSLTYAESTGVGVLKGPTKAVQKAQKAGDDDVIITAGQASFDVDTNISTSTGRVNIVNGKQGGKAAKVVFDETKSLAVLSDPQTVSLTREPRKAGENRLTITAREARMLTDNKTLIATGGVTLVSGDNVTTGDSLYYDDAKNLATVVGRPARNVNKKRGDEISGTTIVNNTRTNQVNIGKSFTLPAGNFKLTGEK
ncbi:MAG TPA: LptA/OstA family protein [Deinococcales bacterium]|nr:LptA/OstA family protein [Deinococcales bacterium]